MGDPTLDARQQKAASFKEAGKTASPIMSNADETSFVDLLLQQLASSATATSRETNRMELARGASEVSTKIVEALREFSIPGTSTAFTQLFRSMDAAFMGLFGLHASLSAASAPELLPATEAIRLGMESAVSRFSSVGWKKPESLASANARANEAAKRGLGTVTLSEKGSLGRLHIRAARQHILGSWDAIVEGKMDGAVMAATQNLHEGFALLIDPNLATEMEMVRSELGLTNLVLSRVFMQVKSSHGTVDQPLADLARATDSLLEMVGLEAKWSSSLSSNASTTSQAAAQQSVSHDSSGPQHDAVHTPTSADPAMHTIVESKTFSRKVHIMDTNYTDEYLGYIEMFMVVNRTASGQVYVLRANARPHLLDRANEYMSVGADVAAYSLREGTSQFTDVYFDVDVSTNAVTSTSSVALSAKGKDKTEGGAEVEAGAGITFSTATTSRGSRAIRRVYRISSIAPKKQLLWDPTAAKLKESETGLSIDEQTDKHVDFTGWEIDDDDVGDELTSFYANWILHSYDEKL